MSEKVKHTELWCQTAREYLESGGAAETLAFTQAVQDAGYHKCQIDIDMALVLLADFIDYPALLAERDRLRTLLREMCDADDQIAGSERGTITAEKIEEALAYLESEHSIKECCGHPVGGNGPEDEPACCAQPDLYLRSDKVKETILSLLQQGEPEGWKLVPVEPTEEMVRAYKGAMRHYIGSLSDAERNKLPETTRRGYEIRDSTKAAIRYKAMLSASPLPPAPGAETGDHSSRQAVLEEAAAVLRDRGFWTAAKEIRALATTPPAEGETK